MEITLPPILYIIAGPPGVGKSTNTNIFIDEQIFVENSDIAALALKNKGEEDYQVMAFEQVRAKAEHNCKLNINFGIELNLGVQIPHYSYVRHWHEKYKYDLAVTLFFTDDINLCLKRAEARYANGGHYVRPEIIKEMYEQTIPLLRKNIAIISHLQLINVTDEADEAPPKLVYSGYYPNQNHEYIHPILPDWVTKNFPEIS